MRSAGLKGPTSPCGRRSATRRRSMPTIPRSHGTQRRHRLLFREGERLDVAFTQFGEVAVPNQSGFIYLVTNRHGQHRLITVSRPTISGEMYGIITTLLAGRGSLLTPIAAPIAFLPIKNIPRPTVGRISSGDANYARLSRAPAPHHRRAVRAVLARVKWKPSLRGARATKQSILSTWRDGLLRFRSAHWTLETLSPYSSRRPRR